MLDVALERLRMLLPVHQLLQYPKVRAGSNERIPLFMTLTEREAPGSVAGLQANVSWSFSGIVSVLVKHVSES
jgi:hypothetical protein